MNVEQVLELVLNDTDDPENDGNRSHKVVTKKLLKKGWFVFWRVWKGAWCLTRPFFRGSALEMLTSLLHISWKQPQEPANVEAFRLLSSSFNFLPIVRREGVLWFNGIYRRLSRRNRIRNPYYAEIRRDIPYAIFNIIVGVVRNVAVLEFCPPSCYHAKTKSAEVISFVTYHSAMKLFCYLSGYKKKVVERYWMRTLGGRRKGNKVKILINTKILNVQSLCA